MSPRRQRGQRFPDGRGWRVLAAASDLSRSGSHRRSQVPARPSGSACRGSEVCQLRGGLLVGQEVYGIVEQRLAEPVLMVGILRQVLPGGAGGQLVGGLVVVPKFFEVR